MDCRTFELGVQCLLMRIDLYRLLDLLWKVAVEISASRRLFAVAGIFQDTNRTIRLKLMDIGRNIHTIIVLRKSIGTGPS